MKKLFCLLITMSLAATACQKTTTQPATPSDAIPQAKTQADPEPAANSDTTAQENNMELRELTADEQITFPSGAQTIAKKGWKIKNLTDGFYLETADGKVQLAIVESPKDKYTNAKDAIKDIKTRFPYAVELVELNFVEAPPVEGIKVAQGDYISKDKAHIENILTREDDNGRVTSIFHGDIPSATKAASDANQMLLSYQTPEDTQKIEQLLTKRDELTAQELANIETAIEDARKKLDISGVAVTLVQNGKTLLAKGFGTREYGKDLPITPKTLFQIGSASKMFTGYLASEAVRQNQSGITWDTPITQFLPEFKVDDETFTKSVTLQQALSMASGMPRKDLGSFFEYGTPEQGFKRYETAKPNFKPGEIFQYSNQMIAAAGYALARTFHKEGTLTEAWRKTMQEQVFNPLGMTATTFDHAVVEKSEHALPTDKTLEYQKLPAPISLTASTSQIEPAGGIWTNMEDIAKFIQAVLTNQDPNHLKRQEPGIAMGAEHYGIATMIQNNGLKVVYHPGGLHGFQSQLMLIPQLNLGFAVMSNDTLSYQFVQYATAKITDVIVGTNVADVLLKQIIEDNEKLKTTLDTQLKFINKTPDEAWMKAIVGKYTSPDLGDVEITNENGKAIFNAGEWKSAIGTLTTNPNTLFFLEGPATGLILQLVKTDDKVTSMLLEENQGVIIHKYELKRVQ